MRKNKEGVKMSEIKFYDVVPITIFDDDHELHKYENYLKVICPVVDETFTISSNKGTLKIYCPGCGKDMFEEKRR